MAITWVRDAILIAGSLQAARPRLQKLEMSDEARQVLNELLDADAELMRRKTASNRFESKHGEMFARITELAKEGNTAASVHERLKTEFGRKTPSRATGTGRMPAPSLRSHFARAESETVRT